MKFVITGFIRLKDSGNQPFKKEIEANSEKHAKDLLYALFGSNNGLKRTQINIKSISKVE